MAENMLEWYKTAKELDDIVKLNDMRLKALRQTQIDKGGRPTKIVKQMRREIEAKLDQAILDRLQYNEANPLNDTSNRYPYQDLATKGGRIPVGSARRTQINVPRQIELMSKIAQPSADYTDYYDANRIYGESRVPPVLKEQFMVGNQPPAIPAEAMQPRLDLDQVEKDQKKALEATKAVNQANKATEKAVEAAKKADEKTGGLWSKIKSNPVTSIAKAGLGTMGGETIGNWAGRNIADIFTDDQSVIDTAGNVGSVVGGLGGAALAFSPAGRLAMAGKAIMGLGALKGGYDLLGLGEDSSPAVNQEIKQEADKLTNAAASGQISESQLDAALRSLAELNAQITLASKQAQKDADRFRTETVPAARALDREMLEKMGL